MKEIHRMIGVPIDRMLFDAQQLGPLYTIRLVLIT